MEEYLTSIGYDQEKALKNFKEKASVIQKDEISERVKGVQPVGGGQDTTGTSATRYGGFGPEPKD